MIEFKKIQNSCWVQNRDSNIHFWYCCSYRLITVSGPRHLLCLVICLAEKEERFGYSGTASGSHSQTTGNGTTSPPRPKKRKRNHAASAESAKRSFRPSIEDHYNEYQEVLEECARRKTTARQLLGTSYCTFTRVRRVAELFIVDPVKARRLFLYLPEAQ